MAKENTFNSRDQVSGDTVRADISLLGYLEKYFPDTMKAQPFMHLGPLNYWQRLFEPAKPHEKKNELRNGGLDWPYGNRIGFMARAFIQLPQVSREIIITARRDGIFWRGDDIEFFNTVIDETHDYRGLTPEEKAKYRQRAMMMAQSLKQRHGQ